MSERGSYCTQFIYCEACAAAVALALNPDEGGYHEQPVSIDRGRILAGRMGGLYPQHEIEEFKGRVIPRIAAVLCHPLRIALLAEAGEQIVRVDPLSGENAE